MYMSSYRWSPNFGIISIFLIFDDISIFKLCLFDEICNMFICIISFRMSDDSVTVDYINKRGLCVVLREKGSQVGRTSKQTLFL